MILVLGGNNNMESILNSIKQLLGIDESETHFDTDIIIHINSVFSILNQLGVGPETTFSIIDSSTTWSDFTDADDDYNTVKTYVYLKVRMIFDPPSSSNVMNAMEKQINELEWRLTVQASNKLMEETDNE